MVEISEELYDALVEFYNSRIQLYDEDFECEYNKEDKYDACVDELMSILAEELEDE